MLFTAVNAIVGIIFLWYSKQKAMKPSPGLLSYFDKTFSKNTQDFVDYAFIDRRHWMLECPDYLFQCCPRVNSLYEDSSIVSKLSDMTPVHAFIYAFVRRLAEAVAQIGASWLFTAWFAMLLFLFVVFWYKLVIRHQTRKRINTHVSGWSLKLIWLLASCLPLSIFLPLLVDVLFGKSYNQQPPCASLPSIPWYAKWFSKQQDNDLLSVLEHFCFSSLHKVLYCSNVNTTAKQTFNDKLCRQVQFSLSWWSSLIFIAGAYMLAALVIENVLWRPVKKILSLWIDSGFCQKALKTVYHNTAFPTLPDFDRCSKMVIAPGDKRPLSSLGFTTNLDCHKDTSKPGDDLPGQFDKHPGPDFLLNEKGDSPCLPVRKICRNMKPESGDSFDVEEIPVPKVVVPRYISRAVSAELESSSSSDGDFDDSDN